MIRSHNYSFYPRVGENRLDQQVRTVLSAHGRGRASDDELREAEDQVTTLVIADQSRAFIDIVTDGLVRWDGPQSRLARHIDGMETRGLCRWFHTNLYDRRLAVTGPLRRREPMLERDYEVAVGIAQAPVKLVLPGPVTTARLAHDAHYRSFEALAEALASVLAEEVGERAAQGASVFQLDEPLLCRHPQDLDLVARTAGTVFAAAGPQAATILSTYYGDLSGVRGGLDRIPGTHLGLDLVDGPANEQLLGGLPAGRGVALGLFDAATTLQEDAADVAARLEPQREHLVTRDVLVGPNTGLELLPRDAAFDKLLHARYLVEKLSQEWTWAS